jgi:putative glycosyltransferase (TIGR04372 family)
MRLFYKIFKPFNPIEWNGIEITEYNFISQTKEFFVQYLLKKNFTIETFLRLLLVFKGLILFILIIIYSPFSIILYLLNFRFLWINTWQLGAYLQQIDTSVKKNILDEKFKLIFLCPNFLLVNNFIHSQYKKKLILIENLILYFLFYPCLHTPFLKKNSWNFETNKKNSTFNLIHKRYKKKFKQYKSINLFLDNEEFIFKKLINKLGIKNEKKIIILQQRDEFFYKSPKTRNADISNFVKAIKYLNKLDYVVIRYKSLSSKLLNYKNKNFKELVVETEKDKIEQLILINKCKLVICYQGGIMGYDYICDTPFLLVNAVPININILIKDNDKLILKKFFSEKYCKYLNVSEIIKNKLHLHVDQRTLSNLRISIVENDQEEILNAVKETLKQKKIASTLQKKALSQFPKKFPFKYSDALICESFIKKHRKLFI